MRLRRNVRHLISYFLIPFSKTFGRIEGIAQGSELSENPPFPDSTLDFPPPTKQWPASVNGQVDCRHPFLTKFNSKEWAMAKPATIKIKLVSTADTGFFYVTKKNPRNITEKMTFRKYDPVVRKHVEFKEAKIK